MRVQLPPPSIDFTLPSPTIGLPKASLTVVDPPWMPHFKTKIEEVTVNQEETVSNGRSPAVGYCGLKLRAPPVLETPGAI